MNRFSISVLFLILLTFQIGCTASRTSTGWQHNLNLRSLVLSGGERVRIASSTSYDGVGVPFGTTDPSNAMGLHGVSMDSTYGYSPDNPIKVGSTNEEHPNSDQKSYLSALLGPNGEPIYYERAGACCPYPQLPEDNRFGVDEAFVDVFIVRIGDRTTPVYLFLTMYEFEEPYAPIGFDFVTAENSPVLNVWQPYPGYLGPEDLERIANDIDRLIAHPLAYDAHDTYSVLMEWLVASPDVSVTLCAEPFSRKHFSPVFDYIGQVMMIHILGMAAYKIRNPETDELSTQVAGVGSVLRAYENMWIYWGNRLRSGYLDTLRRLQQSGLLAGTIEAAIRNCGAENSE